MEESGKKYVLREYLKNPLDREELQDLAQKLGMKPIEFTRTKEADFSAQWLSSTADDVLILKKMASFPKLMERPIVYDETKAFIGRPPENITKIFK